MKTNKNDEYVATGKAIYRVLIKRAPDFESPSFFAFGSLCAAFIILGSEYIEHLNKESIDEYVKAIAQNIKINLNRLSENKNAKK